ncbi:replication factor A protein 3 [Rhizopogon salebrosus TDB-379]|nr:replication factor A protein 3 [Rhizopogon salebrosus TDB-379]
MSDQISMRVNAGRLASLTGNTVRLPCKVLRLSDDTAIVEASDGGQVEIQRKNIEVTGTYIEVVGTVVNASSIKALAAIPLDSDGELDMKLVNDVIELTFESRFDKIFPRYPTHV